MDEQYSSAAVRAVPLSAGRFVGALPRPRLCLWSLHVFSGVGMCVNSLQAVQMGLSPGGPESREAVIENDGWWLLDTVKLRLTLLGLFHVKFAVLPLPSWVAPPLAQRHACFVRM